jgi:hypothetical protein
VRDTLVVATAQIGRLVCDEWLGWSLCSLARAECLRREVTAMHEASRRPRKTRTNPLRPRPPTRVNPVHMLTKLEW